jgi:hypothetical protein
MLSLFRRLRRPSARPANAPALRLERLEGRLPPTALPVAATRNQLFDPIDVRSTADPNPTSYAAPLRPTGTFFGGDSLDTVFLGGVYVG